MAADRSLPPLPPSRGRDGVAPPARRISLELSAPTEDTERALLEDVAREAALLVSKAPPQFTRALAASLARLAQNRSR